MPKYRSDLHLNQLMKKDDQSDFELGDVSDDPKKGSRSCKILLLFSEDGVAASDLAISLAEQVTVGVSSFLLDSVCSVRTCPVRLWHSQRQTDHQKC
jgi:hypothetical protein